MDVSDVHMSSKRCFRLKSSNLVDNVNIAQNSSNSLVVLWNCCQLFVYEGMDFTSVKKVIVPAFEVYQVLVYKNYLMCSDYSGNIYTTPVETVLNPSQKNRFYLRDQNVLAYTLIENSFLSLKYENKSYVLHCNNNDFVVQNRFELTYTGCIPLPEPTQDKCLLTSLELKHLNKDQVENILEFEKLTNSKETYLVAMSFDRITVFGCVYSPLSTDMELKKFYTSPSEISNMEIIQTDCEIYILIGLSIGTMIKLSLNNMTKGLQLIHLNTALYKYLTLHDIIIYTDSTTMWKCDNLFSKDIKFTKSFLQNVKDFKRIGSEIVVTTFTKMIYIFSMDDDTCFNYTKSLEYIPAESLIDDSEYLFKILKAVDRSNDIIKKINRESTFITTLSISNCLDLTENMLEHKMTVYEHFDQAIRDDIDDILLTDTSIEYFKPSIYFVLGDFTATKFQNLFNDILSDEYSDIQLHLCFYTENRLLKTTSVSITKKFKNKLILFPCDIEDENFSKIIIDIKLISCIPGAFDNKQKIWLTLYKKRKILYSEHFMKMITTEPFCKTLKGPIELLSDKIYKTTSSEFESIFQITDISKYHKNATEYNMYVKLPFNYTEILKDENRINVICHIRRLNAKFLLEYLRLEAFMTSQAYLHFQVGNSYVSICVMINEFSYPVLKITSMNMAVAYHIRSFMAHLFYYDYSECLSSKLFYNFGFYSTVENIQRQIKDCLNEKQSYEEFVKLSDQFEKNILATLPL